jgi:TolB-like protein/Tfp pilus assembly protein PilF
MQDKARRQGGCEEPLSQPAIVPLRFAGLVLDLDACTLARESGEAIPLTRGELALLRAFVSRPGRALSRDALLDAVANRPLEPFDRSVDVLVGRLRKKIEPDPKEPRLIVTVPGAGYRFDGLRQVRASEGATDTEESEAQAPAKDSAAMGASASANSVAPPRLSIVVLPFANIGGDPEQEPFIDGVTESLTTDLSRIRGAVVIARNTAFAYKGKPLDVRTIGRELNIRFVLEGSVQRGGNRMRVNVQLIDAETGNHLWAERFDKPLADLFDMQDEIVARLAGALNTQLIAAEARRAEQAPNPDSTDLYFQGLAWLNKGLTADNVAQARRYFESALGADPDNVEALIGSARTDSLAGTMSFVTDPAAAFGAAEAKLTKALSLVPDHAHGHMRLGLIYMNTKRAAEGAAECEHALALDRNLAQAHAFIGFGKIFVGRAEETEARVGHALRLSPRDTNAYIWMTYVGAAKLFIGSYEQAIGWCRRAIEANRNYPHPHFVVGAALAQLGRLDEARSSVKAGLALNPALFISRARTTYRAMSDDLRYQAQLEPIFDGLRKAGVPEG